MAHMERIGIREMRQNLSRYTRRARRGESFVITDRGQAVAQLSPAPGLGSALDRLVAERGARRGEGNLLNVLEELPEPIFTPSTKAELGQHDENISFSQAADILGGRVSYHQAENRDEQGDQFHEASNKE